MNERPAMNAATAVLDPDTASRTLVIERVFKASPDRVFRAWTDPAILVQWWGPEGYETPEQKMDVRPGGAWRTKMVPAKGEPHIASGVYREITPPKRLVTTWAWEQPDGSRGHETVIELTFDPVPGGTRMRLVQRLFRNTEDRDAHNKGWNSTLNKLERLLQ